MMHSNVTLHRLMEQNKWVEDVLRWHGVDPDDVDPRMSVRALCWLEGLDPARFVRDLQAVGVWDLDEDLLVDLIDESGPLEIDPDDDVVDFTIDLDPDPWESARTVC